VNELNRIPLSRSHLQQLRFSSLPPSQIRRWTASRLLLKPLERGSDEELVNSDLARLGELHRETGEAEVGRADGGLIGGRGTEEAERVVVRVAVSDREEKDKSVSKECTGE
jgi:hypothetical protein